METEEQVLSDQESVFGRFIVYAFVFCVIAYFYRKYINGRYFDKPTLCAGKVAIVTGANTGIGKETAIGLAEHEIEVFLACRNMNLANEARDDIIRLTGNQRIHCIQLDLASFASIRKFAKEFLATGKPLHILINNAGVMAHDQAKTEDGHELHIGVNHLGHFLLTMLLLPRLYESKPSRIVNVSSVAHKYAKMNRDDLMGEKKYNRFLAYAQSKLANIYFTLGIAKRLKNSGVTCNSLHPGCVFSELTRNMSSFSWLLRKRLCDVFTYLFFRTTRSGAQTSIYAALDSDIQTANGLYFSDCQIAQMGKECRDEAMEEWLWKKSEEITGVKFDDCYPPLMRKSK